MGDDLDDLVRKDKSLLSGIPEQVFVETAIYLVFIGRNSWTVTETFCRTAQKNLGPSGKSSKALPAVVHRQRKKKHRELLADKAPLSCTLLPQKVKAKKGKRSLPQVEEEDDDESEGPPNKEDAQKPHQRVVGLDDVRLKSGTSNSSQPATRWPTWGSPRGQHEDRTLGKCPSFQSSSSAADRTLMKLPSFQSTSSAAQGAIKLLCFPVEGFAEQVPRCCNMDQWRALCIVYLVDPRQQHRNVIDDLSVRLMEVRHWLSRFTEANGVNCIPALFQVILQHCPTDQKVQPEPFESGEDLAFVEKVRNISQAPTSECIHYLCDFDDVDSFTDCMVQVLDQLWDGRDYNDYTSVNSANPQKNKNQWLDSQAQCCTAM